MPDGTAVHHERRRSEQAALYCGPQRQAATGFTEVESASDTSVPPFVENGLDAFLECGVLRLRCGRPEGPGVTTGRAAALGHDQDPCRLCRGITRPALAFERVPCDATGQVAPSPAPGGAQKNACHCRKTSLAFCALFCGMPLPLRAPRRNWVNWNGTNSHTKL